MSCLAVWLSAPRIALHTDVFGGNPGLARRANGG